MYSIVLVLSFHVGECCSALPLSLDMHLFFYLQSRTSHTHVESLLPLCCFLSSAQLRSLVVTKAPIVTCTAGESQLPSTSTASPAWTVIVDPSCPVITWCRPRPWQPAPAWTPASPPGSCPRSECPFNCLSWRFTSAITWNGWAQVRCIIRPSTYFTP